MRQGMLTVLVQWMNLNKTLKEKDMFRVQQSQLIEIVLLNKQIYFAMEQLFEVLHNQLMKKKALILAAKKLHLSSLNRLYPRKELQIHQHCISKKFRKT